MEKWECLGVDVWTLRPETLRISMAYLKGDEEAVVEFLRQWFLGPVAATVPNEQMADLFGRMLGAIGSPESFVFKGEGRNQRKEYLEKFFRSPLGRFLANDPFQRGAWAQIAGISEDELGAWNRSRLGRFA